MATETPRYEVLEREGSFEVRHYDGYLVAVVRFRASSYVQAVSAGFNLLADYIFGNNTAAGRIAMTAPVSATRAPGERIAMTVPVGATRVDDEYSVTFTMPSKYTLETLPMPNDPRVHIEQVEPFTAATVRFSGYLNDENQAQEQTELEEWIARKGFTVAGPAVSAQYDAPYKPWFARRNEILIPVVTPGH